MHHILPNKIAAISDKNLQLQIHKSRVQTISCLMETMYEIPMNDTKAIKEKEHECQKVVQLLLRKGRKACQLLYSSLEMFCPPLCQEVRHCCPAQISQPLEDTPTQVGLLTSMPPPPTTLIINISNTNMTSCVIGNRNYQSAVVENQPLLHASGLQMHESMRCSCGQQMAPQTTVPPPPSDFQSIDIYGSHLNCVTIGDNNTMEVNLTCEMDPETTTEEQSSLY